MKTIKIDKGIPIPPAIRRKGTSKYPYREMKVGDSILLPSPYQGNYAYQWRLKTGYSFATRQEGDGVRIWRTK